MYKTKNYLFLLSVVIICLFSGLYWNNGYKSEKAHITEVHMVGNFTSFGRFSFSTCKPKRKIGFLKMPKCASSTLSNIFLRYAYKNDLNIILPLERKNSIGNLKEHFSIKMIEDTPWHHLGYDMLAIHTRWNHSAVKHALGGDPVFITIVREPTQQFESMYSYFNFYKFLGHVTLPEFIDKLDQIELEYKLKYNWSLAYNRINEVLGKNQMLFTLGFPVTNFDDKIEVKKFVEEVNKNFHLVMITERMAESIILLKQVLCWDYKDIVNLKLNSRDERVKVNMSLGQTEKLRKWLKADNYLYNKLRDVFDEKVRRFGHEKMEEEKKKLASTMSNILKKCFPGNRIPAERLLLKELREKTGCRLYGFYDSSFLLNFLDLLKSAQWKRADMDILQSLNLN